MSANESDEHCVNRTVVPSHVHLPFPSGQAAHRLLVFNRTRVPKIYSIHTIQPVVYNLALAAAAALLAATDLPSGRSRTLGLVFLLAGRRTVCIPPATRRPVSASEIWLLSAVVHYYQPRQGPLHPPSTCEAARMTRVTYNAARSRDGPAHALDDCLDAEATAAVRQRGSGGSISRV